MKRTLLAALAGAAVGLIALPLGCAHHGGCPSGNCGTGGFAAPGANGYVAPPPGGSAPTYSQPAQPSYSQPAPGGIPGGSGTR